MFFSLLILGRNITMNELRIRDIVLRPGRPKVVVPLVSQHPAEIIEECENLKQLPCDMVEWRADYYFSAIEDIDSYLSDKNGYLDMVKILDDVNYIIGEKPLIFTVRSEGQGGSLKLTKSQLESVYGLAAETKLVDIIDIEFTGADGEVDTEWLRHQIDEAHKHGVKVMLSHHELSETPQAGKIVDMVKKMYVMGADICKFASTALDKKDAENVMKASAFLTKNNIGPIIMIAMGEAGIATRVAAGKYGSCMTFAAGKGNSAPGQADTYTMKKWLDSYYGEDA